jgi:hypothetical protein
MIDIYGRSLVASHRGERYELDLVYCFERWSRRIGPLYIVDRIHHISKSFPITMLLDLFMLALCSSGV